MAHSFDADRLTRINDWMQAYVDSGKYPGFAVLLAEKGEVVHRTALGQRDVEAGKPFEDDTIVRIYSMTKPIASVALMVLAEKGLFHLDAPLSDFLPEFTSPRAMIAGAATLDDTEPCAPPTLRQVATHTAGFTYGFNPGPLSEGYAAKKINFGPQGPGLEAMTKRLAELPLAFTPGSRWEYSVSIDVLGRVVEVVDGRPLGRFLYEEIFQPLGMKDTFFALPDDRIARTANLYTSLDGDPLALGAAPSGGMKLVETAEASAWRGAKTFSGGGGLLSTLDDYFAFAEMIRKGGTHNGARILSPATVRFMTRNHLPGDIASMGPSSFAELPTTGVGFGIGGSVVTDPALMGAPGSVGDFSWGGIASTIFWIDPVNDLTCILLTQLTPSSSYPIRPQLKGLVHGALMA